MPWLEPSSLELGAVRAPAPRGTKVRPGRERNNLVPDLEGRMFQGRRSSPVSIARIETRTTSIGVAGRLEPARRIAHTVGIAGFVETIHVSVGEKVAAGQPLVTLSRDAPGETYRPVVVTSRIAGRVSEIHLTQGAEVRSGAAAVTVIDDSEYRLVAALSDKDAFRVASMGRVALTARSADGVSLRGSLTGVSAEPDYATGLFSATLRFAVQAGARIGMVLFIDLPVETVRGQFVRQELMVRRFGRSVMWIVDDDGQAQADPGDDRQALW